jgi:hypothetical protein
MGALFFAGKSFALYRFQLFREHPQDGYLNYYFA